MEIRVDSSFKVSDPLNRDSIICSSLRELTDVYLAGDSGGDQCGKALIEDINGFDASIGHRRRRHPRASPVLSSQVRCAARGPLAERLAEHVPHGWIGTREARCVRVRLRTRLAALA